MTDSIQLELWLRNWSETSNGGANLAFTVHAEDLEPFKAMTLAKGKGKKAIAGQRFMAVIVPIADDEKADNLPAGPLCRLACIWCREMRFQRWMATTWPGLWQEAMDAVEGFETEGLEAATKFVLCKVCGIESRKELDHDANARRIFTTLIRRPYPEWLHANAA